MDRSNLVSYNFDLPEDVLDPSPLEMREQLVDLGNDKVDLQRELPNT